MSDQTIDRSPALRRSAGVLDVAADRIRGSVRAHQDLGGLTQRKLRRQPNAPGQDQHENGRNA